jgi:septal ring factor EnvC (AmiA/AmiB activator)
MTNEAIVGILRQFRQDMSNVRTTIASRGRTAEQLRSALSDLEKGGAMHREVEGIQGDLNRLHQDVSKLLARLERVEHDRR